MEGKQVTDLGYCKVAAVSWLLHDIAITIDQEIDFIWSRRWSTFTLIFFITRYLPLFIVASSAATSLFPNVSPDICDLFQWIEAGGTFVIIILVQVIMQFRLYVMYQKSRKVLFCNALFCVVELAVAVVLVLKFFTKTTPLLNSPDVYGSCFSHSPREIAVVLLAPLAYESYLAILALNKTFQTRRERFAIGNRTSLMHLLVRDNIVYFFLVAGTLIWVTLVWFLYPVSPGNSLITFTHVSGSIGGTRLILNVRRTALRQNGLTSDTSVPIELPVRNLNKHRSFHVTAGPSFGNVDLDGNDQVVDDMHYDDDEALTPDGLISPVDYGRRRPSSPTDSAIHLNDNGRWQIISGRSNGQAKVLDALRSIP